MRILYNEQLLQIIKIIIKFTLIGGVFLLSFAKWDFKNTLILKPSDVAFIIAILAAFSWLILGKNFKKLKNIEKPILLALILIVFSVFLASLYGYLKYGLVFDFAGLVLFLKLFWLIGLFIIVYLLLKEEPAFLKSLYKAFCLSSIIYLPFLLLPALAQKLSLIGGGYRFMGLTQSPNSQAAISFVAFVFLLVIFLDALFKNDFKRALIFLILWVGVEALTLWSQSRAYFIAIWVVIFLATFLIGKFYKKGLAEIIIFILLIMVVALNTKILVPSQVRELFSRRLVDTKNLIKSPENLQSDIRIQRLIYFRDLFLKDPYLLFLGAGVNYGNKFDLEMKGERFGTESGIFDLVIVGGIGTIVGLIILAIITLKNLKNKFFSEDKEGVIHILGSIVALVGIWVAGIFIGSPLFGFYFWILLAMALV